MPIAKKSRNRGRTLVREPDQLAASARRSFTRLARFFNQLMREQLSRGPVTVQQCYTLEALDGRPLSMNALAAEVGLHQSTLTRVVEKLEKQELVRRERPADNQRSVEVAMTARGRATYDVLDGECGKTVAALIEMIPADRRKTVVESMELLSELLSPENEAFHELLAGCCGPAYETEAGK